MTSREVDPTDLRGQERTKDQTDLAQRTRRQLEIDDFKWVMSDKRGRRVMWRLLDRAGVFRSSFTGNSETFFREGMRNIGLMIVAELNEHCPERYLQMVNEQKEVKAHGQRNADDRTRNH